jgi:hypothetical protein
MTTPTLPDLRANAELTALVPRAARILHEYIDHGIQLWDEPECVAMEDRHLELIREIRALVKQQGAMPDEAKRLVRELDYEFTRSTNSIRLCAMMSLEQAMGK